MKKIFVGLCVMGLLTGCQSSSVSFEQDQIKVEEIQDGLWHYAVLDETQYENRWIGTDAFSVSFWIKPENNYPGTLLCAWGDEEDYVAITGSYRDENGQFGGLSILSYDHGKETWLISEVPTTISTNQWNDVVLNYDHKKMMVFLNGECVIDGNIDAITSTNDFYLGKTSFGEFEEINGYYSDLIFSNQGLPEEEIKTHYESFVPAILLDTISFPDANRLQRSLWLDSNEIQGYPVTWTVLDTDRMDYRGIIDDLSKEGDIRAVAKIEVGPYQAEKEFVFHVAGDPNGEKLFDAKKQLNSYIESVMYSNQSLPTKLGDVGVSYEIKEGNVEIQDGVLTKSSSEEKEEVLVDVTLTLDGEMLKQEYTFTLLDPIYGYIMAYFNGELGEEEAHFAISEDGLHWTKIGTSITPTIGSKRIRDPYLSRKEDGSFLLLATQGFDHPEIYYFHSDDLIEFEDEKLILVDVYDEGLGLSGIRAWAPSVYCDHGVYWICFSDPKEESGPIYSVTTTDFEHFSYPKILFHPGYPVIDGVLFSSQGSYWMMYKDERKAAQTIYYAQTNDLSLGFQKAYDAKFLYPEKYIEGPMVFQRKEGDFGIYVDHYDQQRLYAGTFTVGQEEFEFHWFKEEDYTLPEEVVRHGSILPITEKEYFVLVQN